MFSDCAPFLFIFLKFIAKVIEIDDYPVLLPCSFLNRIFPILDT